MKHLKLKCPECNNKTLARTSMSLKTCFYTCSCGYEVTRKPTKKDVKEMNSLLKTTPRTNIHRVWHDFCKKFIIIIKENNKEKWRWIGYKLITKIEKWARNYKNDVTIVNCDDNSHAGSIMVMIQHRKQHNAEYMGTSIVFVPQCTGEDPSRIFLYPRHHDNLIKALINIKGRNKKNWNKY